MIKLAFIFLYLCATLCWSCGSQTKNAITQAGRWELLFDIGEVKIPARLDISGDGKWTIVNSSEEIIIDSIEWKGANFHVKLPLFNSVLDGKIINSKLLSGTWSDHSRDSIYQIPFEASLKSFSEPKANEDHVYSVVYETLFSPNSSKDQTPAVGLISYLDKKTEGTFMTESGDFRFLEGRIEGSEIYLSCFDGSHLFYFTATRFGDSLVNGVFYSGKHWKEPWVAHEDSTASLRNPDSLTVIENNTGRLKFRVKSLSGESVTLDSTMFKDKVTIVQIFGSWCPNCTDESKFFKNLYSKYGNKGLQIIPVAFERIRDFNKNKEIISQQFEKLGLSYAWYYGGDKTETSSVFAELSQITSFPTAIFIDKSGKIRKIHTGFYGPGTGKYYAHHTELLDMFVAQLLLE